MALLCRIKELKLKPNNIFNQFKRYYFQIHTPRLSSNHSSPNPISEYNRCNRSVNVPKYLGFVDSRVRFFAAPVQAVKKVEVKKLRRPRLNDEIKNVDFVRLVTEEGHSVVSIREAMQRAKELKFDLVEVDQSSNPPVCRVMDYHREMYNKKIKKKEKAKLKSAEKIKSTCKQVRFSAKAELKDIQTKADAARRLMERGYRVKCSALAAQEGKGDLSALLSKICTLLEDVCLVESGPKIDEKGGHMIIRHVKFGKPKSGHKASKISKPTESDIQSESDDEESDEDLNEEVNLGGSRSNDVRGTYISHDKQRSSAHAPNFIPNMRPASQAPNFVPNVGPAPRAPNFVPNVGPAPRAPNFVPNVGPTSQPENRYAKKAPNNSAPVRSPDSGASPYRQSHRFPPVGSRETGSEGSSPRNSRLRHYVDPQPRDDIPNRAGQSGSSFSANGGHSRPPNFTSNDSSKTASFGLLNVSKKNDENVEYGVPINQHARGNSPVLGNINPQTFKSDGSAAGENKKWGSFSGENSVPGSRG